MDPNNQLQSIAARRQQHIDHEEELSRITLSLDRLPPHLKPYQLNEFLLRRADIYWFLGRYEDLYLDLINVNTNGQPIRGPHDLISIYLLWKIRAVAVLEKNPSLAKFLFDWCIPHAVLQIEEAHCLLFKGVAVWLSGNQVEGKKLIKEVSDAFPDFIKETVSISTFCGKEALEKKYFSQSKDYFQRSLIIIPSDTSQHNETISSILSDVATACFHLNEYQTALEKGEEAYEQNPISCNDEAERWKERAETILVKGYFALSIKYSTLAIRLTPEGAKYANLRCTLLSIRSVAYAKTNQDEEALEEAKECVTVNSITTNTKFQEMYVKFIIQGNILLDSHPSLAKLFFGCSFLHAQTPYDEARCLIYKGVAVWLSGDQAKGMLVIEQGSKIYPGIIEQTVDIWKKGGIKALKDKDFSKSKNIFLRTLILIPSDTSQHKETRSSLLSYFATACFHLNEYQTALEKGEEAYELNPISSQEESVRWKERAEKIPREDAFVLFIGCCTLAIKLAPEGDDYRNLRFALLSSRSNAYTKTNQYEQALLDAEECFTLNPNWSKGHHQLGDILDGLGRHRKAVCSYCKAFDVADVAEQINIITKMLSVSENNPDGTTDVTLDVPRDIVNDTIKRCLNDQDWRKLHLLFIGGGGPHKYNYGNGGLATGCDVSDVPLELVVAWGIDNSVNYLPGFLDELIKHGAPILGSPDCNESPRKIAFRKQNQGLIQVFLKYTVKQGHMRREKGTEAYNSGDHQTAVLAYKEAIQCEMGFQERLEVHFSLSSIYYERKDYPNSIYVCNKVLGSLHSKKAETPSVKQIVFELLYLRSSSHYGLKHFQQALKDCIKATETKPDDVKGYTLLVSCYKVLDRRSEMMSALNECLRTECNLDEEWKFLKEAINVAKDLPEGTTALTFMISQVSLERLHEEAIRSKDWDLIRLLYLGGGGQDKHQKGNGGIAMGRVSASSIPIKDVISTQFVAKQETLSVLLDQGASVNGLQENSNPLVFTVQKQELQVAKLLLKYDANPCVKTENNQPLVHKVVQEAIKTGNLQMLECFLASHHSSIENVQDSDGNTLYHLATTGKSNGNKCKVIKLLLKANVDPVIRNKKGKLPIDCCKKNDDRKKTFSKLTQERQNISPSTSKVESASSQDTTKRDLSSASQITTETTSKSEEHNTKGNRKKDLRKELERLIESISIERKIDSRFEDEVEKKADKLQEIAEKSDEGTSTDDVIKGGKSDAEFMQEIDETKLEDLSWEVEFSDKFKKRFEGKKIPQEMKKIIVEKIITLAQGRWNATSCKRLQGEPKRKGIILFESKITKNARMLWEKTTGFSPRCSKDQTLNIYTDIIRVWDLVLDHGNLDHEIENAVRSIVISNERGSQSTGKFMLKGTKDENPRSDTMAKLCHPSFYHEYETQEYNSSNMHKSKTKRPVCFLPASSEENEHNILKFYSFTSPVITALLDNEGKGELDFPFKVTELEHAIINLKPNPTCPILLLGRSGTGKTTCCLYRLWTEFLTYWESADKNEPQIPRYTTSRTSSRGASGGTSERFEAPSSAVNEREDNLEVLEHFHPLFITKNDVLCNEVRNIFKELINNNPATKSTIVCEDSLSTRIQHIGELSWPLIVGSRDWLLLLDASLPGKSFFQRKLDGSLQNKVDGWGKDSKHLRFLSLASDEDRKDTEMERDYADKTEDNHERSKPIRFKNIKRELTYKVFKDEFWPRTRKEIRKELHPTLVWTEIRSFIKGSAEALDTRQGFLSLKEYQKIGRKRAPNFMGDRDIIYELFEFYHRFLATRGMFDEADLVYQLHRRICDNHSELSWSIHSVYVDETQDFTQAELSLLIDCCRFKNNMFFTGDTAQSIMKGITFRFEDIRTLLHSLKSTYDAINVPDCIFQLKKNYRSHSGILKLASSVMKLLNEFFPQSFDKLEEDTALLDGPKPVLLESCSISDLAMILQGNKRETSRIEFGAHQAVLVVSEEARDNMPEELKHGLVLTIYEAKGLEFDDVLIYNFFKDSQAEKEWRVVTSYVVEKEQKEAQSSSQATGLVEIPERSLSFKSRPPLKFQYNQHKILNTEFKLLYTAITRARVNVWFFDENEEARGPMFDYFQRLGLVEMNVIERKEGTSATRLLESATFAKKSTTEDWNDKGIYFYNQGGWALAEKCFTLGCDEHMLSKSKAKRMLQEASAKQDNKTFLTAAVECLKCDMVCEAADCLKNAGENLLLQKLHERMYGKE